MTAFEYVRPDDVAGAVAMVSGDPRAANAVYHATGRRIRSLPITLDKLL
ncbi:MAG TPA: hypothetical protein VGA04_24710 [Streptosporangiaceae bacterium]